MINALAKIWKLSKNAYPETWIFAAIFILTPYVSNRQFFLILLIGFFAFFIISKNVLSALWFTYLSSFPFLKAIPLKVVELYNDINFRGNTYLLFSDVILFFIIYVLITRWKQFNIKLDTKNVAVGIVLLAFFVTAGISTIYAQYTTTSFFYFFWLTKLIFLFFIGKTVFKDPDTAKKTLQIIIFFTFLNSVLIIGQFLIKGPLGIGLEDTFNPYGKYSEQKLFRPGGFANDPNIAATMIAAILPVVLIRTLTVATGAVALNWSILIVLILGLIFTASRAAWGIALIMSLVSVLYLQKNKMIHVPKLIKNNWKIGVLVLVIITAPLIVGRLSTIQQAFTWQGSGLYRFRQIPIGFRMMQESLFGIGLGMFSHPITTYNLPERYQLPSDLPHNILVQIGAETGIIGLVLFTVFVYLLIRSKLAMVKIDAKLLSVSTFFAFISIVLLMMAYPWLMHPRISWLFWILAAYIF